MNIYILEMQEMQEKNINIKVNVAHCGFFSFAVSGTYNRTKLNYNCNDSYLHLNIRSQRNVIECKTDVYGA